MGFPMVYDMTILNEESLVILGPRADVWEGLEVGWAGLFFYFLKSPFQGFPTVYDTTILNG